MENMEIYNRLREVPKEAQKEIRAGRTKGFTDINPMWRIRCLTEQFGPCGIGWYIKPGNKWMEHFGDEVAAFVDVELYVKVDGEWSAPIFGTGGSRFATKEKSGVYVSDECYKMAYTDAISVACKALGIGANVYWSSDRTKYSSNDAGGGQNGNAGQMAMQQANRNQQSQKQLNQNRQQTGKQQAPILVTPAMITSIEKEVERIGWNIPSLLTWIKVPRLEEMTVEAYKFAMDRLTKKPSRQPDPVIPDEEEGLPFA